MDNISLKWANHQGTILSAFDVLLSTESLVDVTLACEGQYIRAHKMILSACSPYFQDLINVDVKKHPIFFLKDVKYTELKALIHYMYRGEVNIAQDDLPSFLAVAQALKIRGLEEVDTGNNDSIPNDTFIQPDIDAEKIDQPSLPPVVPYPASPVEIPSVSSKPRSSVRAPAFVSQVSGLTSTESTSRPPAAKKSRVKTRLSPLSQDGQVKIKKSQIVDPDVQTFPSAVWAQCLNPIQTAFWPSTSSGQYESPDDSPGRSQDTNSGHIGMVENEVYAPDAVELEAISAEIDLESEDNGFSDTWLPGDGDNSGMVDDIGETAGEIVGGSGSRAGKGEVRRRSGRKERVAIKNKKRRVRVQGQFQCLNFNCTRVYKYPGNMSKHLRYECNRSPQFGCTKCDYKGHQKTCLQRHMKLKHKELK